MFGLFQVRRGLATSMPAQRHSMSIFCLLRSFRPIRREVLEVVQCSWLIESRRGKCSSIRDASDTRQTSNNNSSHVLQPFTLSVLQKELPSSKTQCLTSPIAQKPIPLSVATGYGPAASLFQSALFPTLAPRRSTTEHAMQTRQTFESDARRCKARCRYRKCCCGVVFHTVMRAAPSGGPWTVPRIACQSLYEPWPRSAGRGLRRRHYLFRAKCRG